LSLNWKFSHLSKLSQPGRKIYKSEAGVPIYTFGNQIHNTRYTPKNNSNLIIPLVLRGQEIGSIALQRKDRAEWTEPDQDLVKKVAIQVALALDNSRLIEETRQHAVHEQTVNEISGRFNRSLDVDTLLQTAVAN